MGSYTMRLGAVLDSEGDTGTGTKIGLSDYPIPDYWTETDRHNLNYKITQHYYMREIGQETVGLFCFFLRRRMWEIMPPYVQLYESTRIAFDPISSVKLNTQRDDTATEQANRNGTATGNTATTSGGRSVTSDTPSTMLKGDGNYASSGVDSGSTIAGNSTNTTGETANTTNTGNVVSTTGGYQGSPSDLLNKYRSTILNIDMMIIADLYDLFMLVWDTTSEMLPERELYS